MTAFPDVDCRRESGTWLRPPPSPESDRKAIRLISCQRGWRWSPTARTLRVGARVGRELYTPVPPTLLPKPTANRGSRRSTTVTVTWIREAKGPGQSVKLLVRPLGFEPRTNGLRVHCSAVELEARDGRRVYGRARTPGTEWGERGDLNPRPPGPQPGALTELSYAHHAGGQSATRVSVPHRALPTTDGCLGDGTVPRTPIGCWRAGERGTATVAAPRIRRP